MRFLAVFVLIAVAEMATFFWVESRIGLGWALGLAVTTALLGSYLVRRSGVSVLSQIQRRINQGQLPGRELSDGATVLVSGAFLISPGFITDTLGFLLFLPPVRDLVYRFVSNRLALRAKVVSSGFQTTPHESVRDDVIDIPPEDIEEL